MGSAKKNENQPAKLLKRPYKQCPDCSERLPLNAKKCTQCGIRVGRAKADGKAEKPVDWKSYIIAAIFIIIFILYFNKYLLN